MMKQYLLIKKQLAGLFCLLLLLSTQLLYAQQKNVSGLVTNSKGEPVAGVTVQIKKTNKGTRTGADGKFSIACNNNDLLVFSYTGMKTEERTIGQATTLKIEMSDDATNLDNVVVTALGIERSERSLGYGVSTIKSEELETARAADITQALQGKASGIQITSQGGGLGSSTKILIRGLSSIGGQNNPLWVVDGVPIDDANYTNSRTEGSVDFGNRAQDINLDDVESVTVLKGASAAALYGSRASAGVILITTKRGKGKTKIDFNSSYRFDRPMLLPDFQNTYGPGNNGVFGGDIHSADAGWGPKISDAIPYTNYAGEETQFMLMKNNLKDFYETGRTMINNVSLSGSYNGGKNDYRLSVTHTDQKGIMPNSKLAKLNVGFNSGAQLTPKLQSRFSANYTNSKITGAIATGANDPNALMSVINTMSRVTSYSEFKPGRDENGHQINAVGDNTNNPYWILYENERESAVNRFFGNASLEYKPIKDLSFIGRAGYDAYTDTRFRSTNVGTFLALTGSWNDATINRKQLTLDFLGTYDKTFGDFDLTARAGVQWNKRVAQQIGMNAENLTIPGLYDPGNASVVTPFKDFSEKQIFGAFGDITLGFKNWLILNSTFRNDWSSTLPKGLNSYFYPSVALSFIFSDAFNIDKRILSYGKLRASWANVGGDTDPYQLDFLYAARSSWPVTFNAGGNFPFAGQLAFSGPNQVPNQNLKPENQVSNELGMELGFLKNRITLDATFYSNHTDDQIVALSVPGSTGFTKAIQNIGRISNKGFELELGLKVVKHKNFSWDIDANYSKNDMRAEDLGGLPQYNIQGEFSGVLVAATEGGSLGLYGPMFARVPDADGKFIDNQILVNSSGLRQEGASGRLGNVLPDFTTGMTTTLRYKNWALASTFDWKQGGVLLSRTVGILRTSGLAAETEAGRESDYIDDKAYMAVTDANGNTSYVPNNIPVSVQDYWNAYANVRIAEANTFDATYVKWRSVSLSYTFKKNQLKKLPFSNIRLSVDGRNLALLYSKIPHIDPETNLFGAGSDGGGVERGSVPSTRSIGFSLQVNF